MSKKTVLITGCSDGGLGAALAIAFQKAGWRAIASARSPSRLGEMKAAGIETILLDITKADSIANAVMEVSKLTGGSLDALVNNAGGGLYTPVVDTPMDQMKDLFELNVYSLITVTRQFLPLLMRSTHGALIANNTSVAGLAAIPFQGPYCASKAAAGMMSDAMRIELSPFGIKVVDLKTAMVGSKFFDNMVAVDARVTLPADSIFQVAKEAVEADMAGAMPKKNGKPQDTHVWATGVVKDLGKSNPSPAIWRGAGASGIRYLAPFIPTWAMDYLLGQMSAVKDVILGLKAQKDGK